MRLRPRVKVCCIGSVAEARLAVAHGADALGLVAEMPSGPGVISDDRIAEIARAVPPPVSTWLLTSRTDADGVVSHARTCGTDTVQLVDAVGPAVYAALRRALPALRIVQVVHVEDERARSRALAGAPHVDAVLLDSGRPAEGVLGGTGETHDWALSRRIREALDAAGTPVFLAGGLRASNVAAALAAVAPFGVDLCSGVRTAGRLDAARLGAYMDAVGGAETVAAP